MTDPRPSRTTVRQRLDRARSFFARDLWDCDLAALPSWKASVYRILRIGYIVWNGFAKVRLPQQAAALTFTLLLSIVPMLAFAFSMAKGLGAQKKLQELMNRIPEEWPAELRNMIFGLYERVETTDFSALGTFSLLFLMYVVIRTLATIENSLNEVWGVKAGRSWARKTSDYISVLVVAPILLLSATTANTLVTSESAMAALERWTRIPAAWYGFLFNLLPYALIWIAFTAVYLVLPNTHVRFASALVGGIFAGTTWQIVQWAYIHFQITIGRYNAIYGTFASVPIFMMWMYISWLILLAGAEVAFAHQNYRNYQAEEGSKRAGFAIREALGLEIAAAVARSFLDGTGPWRPSAYGQRRDIPLRLVNELLHDLVEADILVGTAGPRPAYLPARDPGQISVNEVVAILRGPGIERRGEFPCAEVDDLLRKASSARERQLQGTTLRDLCVAKPV